MTLIEFIDVLVYLTDVRRCVIVIGHRSLPLHRMALLTVAAALHHRPSGILIGVPRLVAESNLIVTPAHIDGKHVQTRCVI